MAWFYDTFIKMYVHVILLYISIVLMYYFLVGSLIILAASHYTYKYCPISLAR